MSVENVWTKAGIKAGKKGWEEESHPFLYDGEKGKKKSRNTTHYFYMKSS
ncbi:hypothetical protein [Bacillus infantis]|nr:hypothetical protein [Bacillus infantis]